MSSSPTLSNAQHRVLKVVGVTHEGWDAKRSTGGDRNDWHSKSVAALGDQT